MAKVENLTLEQLRDEVEYWRADCAARLSAMRTLVDHLVEKVGKGAAVGVEVQWIMSSSAALEDALAGKYHETPECCDTPLRHGDLVFSESEGGWLHAACMGEVTSAEGFVGPEGEALPADTPIPQPTPYDSGYDAERVERELAKTNAWLKARGGL